MATSKYDKFRPNSIKIHSGRSRALTGNDLSVVQETLAMDMSEMSRVFNNLMDVIYPFSSTLGKGGLIKTTEDRFDYTYDFASEYGLRPADYGLEGRSIFIYTSEDDSVYSDPDFDELHGIFWSENSDGERRPNTIFETFLELKEYVDTTVASIVEPTYTLSAPERLMLGSNVLLDQAGPTRAVFQFAFDASVYPSTINMYFAGVGTVDGPTADLSMDVSLYNLTDSESVTNATLNFSSSSPVQKKSVALTRSAASGSLKNAEKLYEVRLTFNSVADSADIASLGSVYLIIQ